MIQCALRLLESRRVLLPRHEFTGCRCASADSATENVHGIVNGGDRPNGIPASTGKVLKYFNTGCAVEHERYVVGQM